MRHAAAQARAADRSPRRAARQAAQARPAARRRQLAARRRTDARPSRRSRQAATPRLDRLRSGEIPGIRGDEHGRPYATIVLVALSFGLWLSLAFYAKADFAISAIGGDPWRFFTASLLNDGTAAQFAAVVGVGLVRLADRATPGPDRGRAAVLALRTGRAGGGVGGRRDDVRLRHPRRRARAALRLARPGRCSSAVAARATTTPTCSACSSSRRCCCSCRCCRRAARSPGCSAPHSGRSSASASCCPPVERVTADALQRRGGRRRRRGAVGPRALRPRPGDRHARRTRVCRSCSARRSQQGGWFDQAHDAQLASAAGTEDPSARLVAIRTLVEEETRLGMLVGVSVGFELARELAARRNDSQQGGEG